MADPGWAHAFRGRAAFEHDQVRGVSKLAWGMRVIRSICLSEAIATRHAGGSSRRARRSQTSPAGAVEPLAERASPSGSHPEWRVHVLGISGPSAQTRSLY